MFTISEKVLADGSLTERAKRAFDELRTMFFHLQELQQFICVAVTGYLLAKEVDDSILPKIDELTSLAEDYATRYSGISKEKVLRLKSNYTAEVFLLAAYIALGYVTKDNECTTPDCLAELGARILDIKSGDAVADICSGMGTFLFTALQKEPDASFFGFDVNSLCYLIASLKNTLLGNKVSLSLLNAFDLVLDPARNGMKFTKVFSNYPFGLGLRYLGDGKSLPEKLKARYPWLTNSTSSDWAFNSLICDMLEEGGKAVALMTNGSLWNASDTLARKHFVENGLIEAVIGLPKSMLPYTYLRVSMVVFSRGNSNVRIVDASNWVTPGRRINQLSKKDIDMVIDAVSHDGEHSFLVSKDNIRSNDYRLNVDRYVMGEIHFTNGKPFSSVIKRITRGAPCTARELDEITSTDSTNMQYLMLANIKKGQIEDNLPYLKSVDAKYEKYCLKNDDLILSKNGYPYKVAIASVKDGRKILANGNLYIIEIDKEKANPYYLKAFFESDQGITCLKSITVGTAMPNIGIEPLKNLEIPIPSLEEQNNIALKYLSKLDEIKMLQMSLEKAEEELSNIFNEEVALG